MFKGKTIIVSDLQAKARELRSSQVNSGQRMVPFSLGEAVNEQRDHRQGNIVSMMRGQRITADPCYPQRSINKVVNEQHVDPPGQRSVHHVPRKKQDSLRTDQHRGENTDDEIHKQHVHPQDKIVAITRGKRSKRIANNNQRKEQSIFDADQRVGGNTNESATEQPDGSQGTFEHINIHY
ncbi:hypothetical protein ACS0TY_011025 [Phlomoides rotata]